MPFSHMAVGSNGFVTVSRVDGSCSQINIKHVIYVHVCVCYILSSYQKCIVRKNITNRAASTQSSDSFISFCLRVSDCQMYSGLLD